MKTVIKSRNVAICFFIRNFSLALTKRSDFLSYDKNIKGQLINLFFQINTIISFIVEKKFPEIKLPFQARTSAFHQWNLNL